MVSSTLQSLWQSLLSANRTTSASSGTDRKEPYWILLESSRRFRLRAHYASSCRSGAVSSSTGAGDRTSGSNDDAIYYHRAGLRTPEELAAIDWKAGPLWLQCIVESWLRLPVTAMKTKDCDDESCHRLLWLQMGAANTATRKQWLASIQAQFGPERFSLLDCCGSDPFGWGDENANGGAGLERLDGLLERIVEEEQQKSSQSSTDRSLCIVIDSLTPILVRHGLNRTAQFLNKISEKVQPVLLVLPVLTETLSRRNLQVLEDFSHAVLLVKDGKAEMVRQGVREKGSRVREKLPFEFRNVAGTLSVEIVEPSSASEDEIIKTDLQEETIPAFPSLSVSTDENVSRRTGKVQLQTSEGSRNISANDTQTHVSQPRIFMQDDDPEFADYDEDDPDDDLDL